MRFEVPQFIEIEDKIVGPLTWKQFVYMAGGIGLLVVLFFSLPFFIFIIFGLPIAALSASLAFHKVNNRPFSYFLEAAFSYLTKGKLYLWRKEEVQSVIERDTPILPQSTPDLSAVNRRAIHTLSSKLENHLPE